MNSNLPKDGRTCDYANWFMYMEQRGETVTRADKQLYFDAVNRERHAHMRQYGSYGDGWGPGTATVDGFMKF